MSDTPGWTPPEPGGQPPDPGAAAPPAPGWGAAPTPPPAWQQQGWQQGGWQQGPGWAPVKPGVVPLRPLGLGEILDGAITTMRTYPKATLGFAAVIATVTQLMSFVYTVSLRSETEAVTTDSFDSALAELAVGFGLLFILGFVADLVLTGCLTVIIGQAVLGRPVSLGQAWARVRPRIWALVGASLLAGLIVVGGFLLCVIPAIYFGVAFSLATPALVLENQPVTKALRRSWDLVKGSWWRIFGILLLTTVIAFMVESVLTVPFVLVAGTSGFFADSPGDLSTMALALQSVGAIVATTITGPLTALVSALLYIDLRMRREGLDVTLAATAGVPPPAAGPSWS